MPDNLAEVAATPPATPDPAAPAATPDPAAPATPDPAAPVPESIASVGENPFITEGFEVAGVPEKFLREGKVDVSGLLASFGELEKSQTANNGFIGDPPEEFTFAHPKIEGVDDERIQKVINSDDPLVKSFQTLAKGLNFTQKGHDTMMEWFVGASIEAQKGVIASEMAKLGDGGTELVTKNSKFFEANLSAEGFAGVKEAMVSANAVKALDEIRKKFGDTILPGGDPVPSALTEEGLKDIMKTEAYNDPQHADYNRLRNQVEEGYKKLFPDT